jgi:hypothetical protein
MRTWTRRLAPALIAGLALGAHLNGAPVQAADPVVGTWKMNAAKSKFDPGPPLKSLTIIFAPAGEGIKAAADVVTADGAPGHTEFTAQYDGKDYPITGSPTADTVTLKKIDATTSERTDKKGGKVVATFIRKLSPDGKSMTVTQTGTDPQGRAFTNTVVLDKH